MTGVDCLQRLRARLTAWRQESCREMSWIDALVTVVGVWGLCALSHAIAGSMRALFSELALLETDEQRDNVWQKARDRCGYSPWDLAILCLVGAAVLGWTHIERLVGDVARITAALTGFPQGVLMRGLTILLLVAVISATLYARIWLCRKDLAQAVRRELRHRGIAVCMRCGYGLRGLGEGATCPECGQQQAGLSCRVCGGLGFVKQTSALVTGVCALVFFLFTYLALAIFLYSAFLAAPLHAWPFIVGGLILSAIGLASAVFAARRLTKCFSSRGRQLCHWCEGTGQERRESSLTGEKRPAEESDD